MEKLAQIQRELKAPKGQRNDFGGFNYRSCEDILTAVKPLLGDATLTISDEIVLIGDRYYVRATATLIYDKEQHSVSAYARETATKKGMDEAQITGAASSYARKYALNGLFAIDDTKDPDSGDNRDKKEKDTESMVKSSEQLSKYIDHIDKLDSAAKVIDYVSGIWDEVKKTLSKEDKDKLKKYANQIVDTFNQG